jgi:ADP-ribosylglycohydrolase
MGTIEEPINDSKGCGGVMRAAPAGLIAHDVEEAFRLGCEIAALTHGHPSGYIASGFLAAVIHVVKDGGWLDDAVATSINLLKTYPRQEECLEAVERAVDLAQNSHSVPETIEKMGGGWIVEEALAISLYCAVVCKDDFKKGVLLAVNHSGDSDSTGAITGNILGCLLGASAIPFSWLDELELKDVIQEMGVDLFIKFQGRPYWWNKYPGY